MRYMIFCLVCLAASCGAGASQPVREQRAVVAERFYQGFALEMGGNATAVQRDGPGAPIIHLEPGGWARYNASSLNPNFHNAFFEVKPENAEQDGEFWVGLQDKGRKRWQWFGPLSPTDKNEGLLRFGDPLLGTFHPWDLLANSNNVVIYCTKTFDMAGIDYQFLPNYLLP